MDVKNGKKKTRRDGDPVTLDWIWEQSVPEPNSGCWLWTLFIDEKGYAKVHVKRGRSHRAHRVSYELKNGPFPSHLHIDHLCRVRCCVNPDHVEPVTPLENTRRGLHGALYKPPSVCRKGHVFGPENPPILKEGSKAWCCAICRKAITKKWNDITNGRKAAERRLRRSIAA